MFDFSVLPTQELASLVEAVCFGPAWKGIWALSRIEHEGWNKRLHLSLTRWQRWYAISTDIAHLASAVIERIKK